MVVEKPKQNIMFMAPKKTTTKTMKNTMKKFMYNAH